MIAMEPARSVPESRSGQADDLAIRQACGALFAEPERLIKAHWFHWIEPPHSMPEHAHEDWLQLDMSIGCTGAVCVDGKPRPVDGATLAAFYPNERHHLFDVHRVNDSARILSLKIRVDLDWPLIKNRVLTSHCARFMASEQMAAAWHRLIRLQAMPGGAHCVERLLSLCEILCLWPRARWRSADTLPMGFHDPQVEQAMLHLEQNIHRAISLVELADLVALSPRHLVRRFVACCGCSPRSYADAQRMLRARQLLSRRVPVKQVGQLLGFSTIHSFSRWFRRQAGCPPSRLVGEE
jgi:AraC-like DNA-binding protein